MSSNQTENTDKIEPWKERFYEEQKQLAERHNKLMAFVGTGEFLSLPVADQDLLMIQLGAMSAYRAALGARARRFVN